VLAHVLEGLEDAKRFVDRPADRGVVDRRVLDDAIGRVATFLADYQQ